MAAGLAGAVAVSRSIQSLLFEVRPNDPSVLLLCTGVLAAVALLACWIPTRRATRVNAILAFRNWKRLSH